MMNMKLTMMNMTVRIKLVILIMMNKMNMMILIVIFMIKTNLMLMLMLMMVVVVVVVVRWWEIMIQPWYNRRHCDRMYSNESEINDYDDQMMTTHVRQRHAVSAKWLMMLGTTSWQSMVAKKCSALTKNSRFRTVKVIIATIFHLQLYIWIILRLPIIPR